MPWMAGTLKKRTSHLVVPQITTQGRHLQPTLVATKNENSHSNVAQQLTNLINIWLNSEATNMFISRFIILSILIYKTIYMDQ